MDTPDTPHAHPLDQTIALQALGAGQYLGHTHPAYANMVGPFGGATAAQALQAVLLEPQRLGEPVSFTVNFCAPLADGPLTVLTRATRTNRSTQHWWIEVQQQGHVVTTATLVTAVRRSTWSVDDEAMPAVPAAQGLASLPGPGPMAFVDRYDIRPIVGVWPTAWDGSGHNSLTQMWVRDQPTRALDFAGLACVADIFFPRIFVRRALQVPVGTVSMTVYFHASTSDLQATGTGFLLGQARGQSFRNGFFDQTAQLWNEAGVLLATTHQIIYYKE